MTVYPDLAFFMSMFIHTGAYVLSLLFLQLQRPKWQCGLSIILSSAASAFALIPLIPMIVPLTIGLASAVFLWRGNTLRGTVFNTGIGCLISFLYIGVWLLFCGAIFSLKLAFFQGEGYFILPLFQGVISSVLAFFCGWVVFRIRKKAVTQSRYCCCEIDLEQKTLSVRCYVDTGNFLTDPMSGNPVVILEYSLFRRFFGTDFPRPMTYEFSARFSRRARVVPYRTISGDGQMLSAFLPDDFRVEGVSCKVVVAVTDRVIDRRGRFSGIIGSNLLKGDMQ